MWLHEENEQDLELFQSVDMFVLKLNFDRWRGGKKMAYCEGIYVGFSEMTQIEAYDLRNNISS